MGTVAATGKGEAKIKPLCRRRLAHMRCALRRTQPSWNPGAPPFVEVSHIAHSFGSSLLRWFDFLVEPSATGARGNAGEKIALDHFSSLHKHGHA